MAEGQNSALERESTVKAESDTPSVHWTNKRNLGTDRAFRTTEDNPYMKLLAEEFCLTSVADGSCNCCALQ